MNKSIANGKIINSRYRIESKMAHGGMGQTYEAFDLVNECKVVVKMLLFSQMTEWKSLDLFEREVKTLKNLNHFSIPRYLDDFKLEGKDDIAYFLIQEYIEGENLYELIEQGRRFAIDEVMAIFRSLLMTLDYIHNIHPAVIHRDIQPKNIILNGSKAYLVDFGSVGQIALDTFAAGNTFVGTIGYFPHEQMIGKVSPSSDLYALAMSMIFLLTAKHPADMETKRGKVVYERYVQIPDSLKNCLDRMIEPIQEDRYQTAASVLEDFGVEEQKALPEIVEPEIEESSDEKINFFIKEANKDQSDLNSPLGYLTSFLILFNIAAAIIGAFNREYFLEITITSFCVSLVLLAFGILFNAQKRGLEEIKYDEEQKALPEIVEPDIEESSDEKINFFIKDVNKDQSDLDLNETTDNVNFFQPIDTIIARLIIANSVAFIFGVLVLDKLLSMLLLLFAVSMLVMITNYALKTK